MSKSLVGRRGGKRIVLWGRVWARGLDAALVAVVLFLIVTCVVGASNEAPFSETWWGKHVFILLLGFVALPVLVAVVLPLLKWLRLPLDRLPELAVGPDGVGFEDRSSRRIPRRGVVAIVAVVAVPVLVGLFYVEENIRGERAWNKYRRQQEARGERLDPAALVPPPVPDDQNFATTPCLAPLFDYLPGTQQPRDPIAAERAKSLSPRYEAAANRVAGRRRAVSNSWSLAETDLPAWYTAFTNGITYMRDFSDSARVPAARPGEVSGAVSPSIPPPTTNVPTVAEAAAGVLAALGEAESVLEELRAASRRPHSRFNLRYDMDNPAAIHLPHYTAIKRAIQVLQLRASAELALGRTDEAAEDIQLMFRLADVIRNEPMVISHLVRLSILNITLQPLGEGLARHQWSEAQLRTFEARLRQFDFLADARQALQGERIVFGGGVIDYVRRSPKKYDEMRIGLESGNSQQPGFSWQAALLAAIPSGWFYLEKLNYSRTFQDYLLPTIDVPGHRVSSEACGRTAAQFDAMHANPRLVLVLRHQFFSAFMLPALSGMVQKTAMAQTGAECAALACALEHYRLTHGQFPESLGALVPDFIGNLPHDPINGQPLNYRLTIDGHYMMYSVGWDEADGGGVIGLKPDGKHMDPTTGDWVWRLPAG